MPDNYDFDDDGKQGFLQRFRAPLIVVGVLLFGAAGFGVYKTFLSGHGGASQTHTAEIIAIRLPPPPPPPPPPPAPKLPPPPQQEKMVDQEHVDEKVEKPQEKPDAPPPDLGTGLKGDGPGDGFGLGNGGGNGTIGGSGGGGGGRWGWYASEIQSRIADALRQNTHTRGASLRVQVRIWPDGTGRVTRAQLVDSTGDLAVDNAIKNEILTGLQLQEPPPAGMPLPIVLRLTARRPN